MCLPLPRLLPVAVGPHGFVARAVRVRGPPCGRWRRLRPVSWAWGCLLRFRVWGVWGCALGCVPGLLSRWSARVLRWYARAPFLVLGPVRCPGSPLFPWGSASWVSFCLGRAARPWGFRWAWRGPRTMVRYCILVPANTPAPIATRSSVVIWVSGGCWFQCLRPSPPLGVGCSRG